MPTIFLSVAGWPGIAVLALARMRIEWSRRAGRARFQSVRDEHGNQRKCRIPTQPVPVVDENAALKAAQTHG